MVFSKSISCLFFIMIEDTLAVDVNYVRRL